MLTPKKAFMFMFTGNFLLIAILFASVYFGNSFIQKEADKLNDAKIKNGVVEQQQIQLAQAKKDVEQYLGLNEVVKSIVPQDKDQARTVREITKIAEESDIKLKNISFPTSNLGEKSAPVAPTPTAAPETSESTTPATPAKPSTPPASQLSPVPGISGVYAMEITINSVDTEPIPYENFIDFLEKLENNRRTSNVTSVNVQPSAENPQAVSFSLTINAYVKP